MKNTIRNLLFLSCLLLAISYDSCTLGVDYDRRNMLYPELDFSCCFIGERYYYGRRWERLGSAAFLFGLGSSLAAFIVLRRKKQNEDLRLSILTTKE